MSISSASNDVKDISIEEFKKSELVNFYNHVIYADLLVISNRDIHLLALKREFIKFSRFIMHPSNKKHFRVFLCPVFEHFQLLLRCHCGNSDAERFTEYFKYLNIRSDVNRETVKDLQDSIYRKTRIRVKLSIPAYQTLMNWLRDCLKTLEMFNTLRVLHENFHLDVYHDKDDKDFSAVEEVVLKSMQKWMADYEALKIPKMSGPEVFAETCKTEQSDDDCMSQKMCNLEIGDETPKMMETSETSTTSESSGNERNFEVKSSMFKLKESARRYLEKVKQSGWDLEKMEQALLNPPDLDTAVSSDTENDDQVMDFLDDPRPLSDENAGLSPSENTVPVSPGGSEYVICSDASTEKDDGQETDSIDIDDQDLNDGNDDSTEILQNTESTDQETSQVPSENTEDGVTVSKSSQHFFNNCYKTNFHSAYPITISGKDVLCSSEVSSDLLYLACGFESCKISTWHLCCKGISKSGIKIKPLGTLRGHKGIVYALSIDSIRKFLISGSHDCTVRIWDLEKSTFLFYISAHSAPVYAVCVSPNSGYFLSASQNREIALVFYDDEYPVRVYTGHSMDAINCVRFHPNCSYFASASSDGNVFLFKMNFDSCPVRMFSKHVAKVYTLAFSPCGKQLASADIEGMLVVWDILTYSPIATIETGQGIRSISYDTSGSFITALFYYKSWKVFNVEENNIDVVIEAESVGVPKSVHFSTDNKMIIVQYIEADKKEIAEKIEEPKTKIIKVN